MQGVPGSGKSTLAKELALKYNATICSTDKFFEENGIYKFDPKKLSDNHAKNLNKAKELMELKLNVIIDNTNIYKKHAKPYIDIAKKLNYEILIIRTTGRYNNIHGVSNEKVEQMISAMENLTELI